MSTMRLSPNRGAVAILVSDLHLQQVPPRVRKEEPDWYDAMKRPLDQIKKLSKNNNDCAILYAGDIFDRWNSPAELINWAIKNLPKGYSIPGQHDLPHHNYQDIRKSAYWTLVEAGVLINLRPDECTTILSNEFYLDVYPFPWEHPVTPLDSPTRHLSIALIHAYIWDTKENSYHGALDSKSLPAWLKKLRGYDVAVFGDNHKGFLYESSKINIVNNGTLMRRTIDEYNYQPCVGKLYADGVIVRQSLDCSTDVIMKPEESKNEKIDLSELVGLFGKLLSNKPKDFLSMLSAVKEGKNITKTMNTIINELMEEIGE